MSSIAFRGKQIPVTAAAPADADAAINTDLFKKWLAGLDSSLTLRSITIQSVDRFGSSRIGFIKFAADLTRNGVRIPGIVLLRGPAVAVLLIITDADTGEQSTIIVQQPRVPIGRIFLEIPAGMTDGGGNLRGIAIKELEEECDLVARPDDLIDLTELAYGGAEPGVYMSPGLVDEFITLFLWRMTLPHARIAELEGKLGGEDDHEQIVLRIVRLADVWKRCPDNKTLAALALYNNLLAAGRL
jgi:8-oxo-dGTP pyrophosphatase MutT (NUDIX family)